MPPLDRKLLEWAKRKREHKGTLGILLEGEKLIVEAITSNIKFEKVWVTPSIIESNPRLVNSLRLSGIIFDEINARTLEKVSDMETPPGIIAAAHQPLKRLCEPVDKWRFIVALFRAQDPGNVGGILRTAEYFGADEVWLNEQSADPYSPKSVRGSMGAALRLPVFRGDLHKRINHFKPSGAVAWAAVAHGEAASEFDDSPRKILMLGSESHGLADRDLALADKAIKIPGRGRSESLNLGVAAGILIHNALGTDKTETAKNSPKGKK